MFFLSKINFSESMQLQNVNCGFYITLDREPYITRRQTFENCFEIFYGFDKQNANRECNLWKLGNKVTDKLKFVYANSYSHYMLLNHMLQQDWSAQFMFVIEDDCVFFNNFENLWNTAVYNIPQDADIVYLFHHPYHDRENGHVRHFINDFVGYPMGPFSTTAYAISKKGTQKIVSWFETDGIYRSFDSILNIRRRDLKVYVLANSMCYEHKNYGSERLQKT